MKSDLINNIGEVEETDGDRGRAWLPGKFSSTYLFLGLVAIFSFALGYLYNEVRYIEKLLGQ